MKTLTLFTVLTIAAAAPRVAAADTPAEGRIAVARAALEEHPKAVTHWNALALGLSQRARETADPDFYDQSDAALAKSLELSPDDFTARKLRVWNMLGRHEFAAGLAAARELNAAMPDDVLVYGFVTDACVELGRYDEAEEACQWMLDMRPGNPGALTRASYLRELLGDVEGAIELMTTAFHAIRPREVEDRAWILTQLAHLELAQGRTLPAERYAEYALELFPDYHYALAELAQVRVRQGRSADAAELLRRRFELAPHPENGYQLAVVIAELGEHDEAQRLFAEFEVAALGESEGVDNANLDLVEYWLEHCDADRSADALDLARRQVATRRDIHSLEALAWALHANGEHAQALGIAREMLAVGTRDVRKLHRAGVIALAVGSDDDARTWFGWALRQDPESRFGRAAAAALRSLPEQEGGGG